MILEDIDQDFEKKPPKNLHVSWADSEEKKVNLNLDESVGEIQTDESLDDKEKDDFGQQLTPLR